MQRDFIWRLLRLGAAEVTSVGKSGSYQLRVPLALISLLLMCHTVSAQQPSVGVVAPLSGAAAILGAQVQAGALQAADKAGVAGFVLDDQCTAEGGTAAAREAIARKATILVGFLCADSLEAALPLLKDADIPVITVGVRLDSLTDKRDKTGWPIYRLAPRADAEGDAVARLLPRLWRDEPFAVVDDGTIYGRDLAEVFRAASQVEGLKPVFTDTYRPDLDNQIALVGRLRKAGATRVFVGGNLRDVAIMARDAKSVGADMVFAGGEVLRTDTGDVPLEAGTLMIGLPDWSEVADNSVVAEFNARQIVPEGYVLPAYAAMQVAADAIRAGTDKVKDALASTKFQTVLGEVAFDAKGDLTRSLYALYRFDGTRFVLVEQKP
ncbi:branched-chain amino acid ABC transporter substrate-binding protein [Mesorhizobium denitrificans]|uniref:ABC transporter substrate-binding protein n=2 Tax=Mesorhizobium denitrificans TaxID=2294114 RepID=A0A371X6L7_9HYPH|nr:ABC transporter substrate-binding protein [Mesorhizobium denitrificans]